MEKQNILLVDDRPENLIALEAILEGPDRRLVSVNSGNEALHELLKDDFALVLLDVQMPDMDGFEVAELMRQSQSAKVVPIIFVTAINKEQQYVFRGYEKGAVDYLFKPLDPYIITAKVKFFLELDKKNKLLERRLEEVKKLKDDNELILKSVGEGVVGLDQQGIITFVNPAATRMLAQDSETLISSNISAWFCTDEAGQDSFEWLGSKAYRRCLEGDSCHKDDGVYARRDGACFPVEYIATPIIQKADQYCGAVLAFQDITSRKKAERQLIQSAQYDSLTGLVNRNLFEKMLKLAIARAKRAGHLVSLMFLDLDRFKQVNDSLGHSVGDQLLQEVAKRLQRCTREVDTVSRLGGDEFTIIIEGVSHPDSVAVVAKKVLNELSTKFLLKDGACEYEVVVGASIGIVNYPDSGQDVTSLLKCADIAMYHAKSEGRNNYQYFTADMQKRISRNIDMENKLRNALSNNEFTLVYQPQVDIGSGDIVGVEALLRWQLESGEFIPPDQFIPLTEETGLIIPIGEWITLEACRQICIWNKAGYSKSPLTISVNLSVRQLCDRKLLKMIRNILAETGIKPQWLVLEITESMVMDSPEEKIRILEELQSLGISIAIDDFGTGYSSLSYVKKLPIDILKVDREFIKDINQDRNGEAIIRAILALSKSLGLKVVAEGVEEVGQVEFLEQIGCDYVQGFFYSKPLSVIDLERRFKSGWGGCKASNEPEVAMPLCSVVP
ncbi:MAG: two-component system response regulator [Gammaproteobacteria bacterium]|nr:MAG: two-component system response regulator [Gammaproteobacteria bacterium]